MITTLPPEVIRLVVGNLLAVTRYNEDDENSWIVGSIHELGKDETSYTRCRTWNEIGQPENLANLAHTSKYLRSVVYPVLFNTVACYNPFTSKLGFHAELGFNYTFREGPVPTGHSNSVLNRSSKPQFHLIPSYTALSTEALRHLHCLHLSVSAVTYKPWLSDLLPCMTFLQEVRFYITVQHDTDEVAYIIEELLKHKNRLRVHVYIGLSFGLNGDLIKTFHAFENEWAQIKDLKIESLTIEFGSRHNTFPKFFLDMISELSALKKLSIFCLYEEELTYELGRSWECHEMGHVLHLLKKLPNLEEFNVDFGLHHFDWPLNDRISTMTVPVWMLQTPGTFEVFDNVTHLEITNKFSSVDVTPPFRNLQTLGLHDFSFRTPKLLEHFVSNNPKLVNLHLDTCSFPVQADEFVCHFSKIQRLELSITHLDFKRVLLAAPCLRQLVFLPSGDLNGYDLFSLSWLVDAVLNGQVSPDLERIEVQPVSVLPGLGKKISGVEWARDFLVHRVSEEVAKKIIVPIVCYKEREITGFLIDVKAIRKFASL